MTMRTETLKTVLTEEQISKRVGELAADISAHYRDEPLVCVCVLKGAFMFFADLVRRLTIDPEIDFVRLASYGDKKSRSDEILFTKDMEVSIKDKHVLIVEDIVDTGHSMDFLTKVFQERRPRSVKICALVDKWARREIACGVDFPGFSVQDGFLVGYGLDFAERLRNLSAIHEIVRPA